MSNNKERKDLVMSYKNSSKYHLLFRTFGALFSVMLLAFIFLPEITNKTYADTHVSYDNDTRSYSFRSLNSDPNDYSLYLMRGGRIDDVQYGVLGIEFTINDASSMGYTITMRSDSNYGRLSHKVPGLSDTNYLSPLDEQLTVTTMSNPFLTETRNINHYGYRVSTENKLYPTYANENFVYNPVPVKDTVIRRTNNNRDEDGDGNPDNNKTYLYFGVSVNNDLARGEYEGKIIITVMNNLETNMFDYYRLAFDGNETNTINGLPQTEEKQFSSTANEAAGITSATFDFNGLDSDGRQLDPNDPIILGTIDKHKFVGYSVDKLIFDNDGIAYKFDTETKKYVISNDYTVFKFQNGKWNTCSGSLNNCHEGANVEVNQKDVESGVVVKEDAIDYIYTRNIYAVWEQPTWDLAFMSAGAEAKQVLLPDGNTTSFFSMQDLTADVCSTVLPATGKTNEDTKTTILIDSRDGNRYPVSKLLDGNCWMTSNLALGGATAKTWYFNTTNLSSNDIEGYKLDIEASGEYLSKASIRTSFEPGQIPINEIISSIVGLEGDKQCSDGTVPSSDLCSDDKFREQSSENSINYMKFADNSDLSESISVFNYDYEVENVINSIDSENRYGSYYPYYLATAGNTSKYSVCPKGWKLPNTETKDLENLLSYYEGNYTEGPLNLTLSGVLHPSTSREYTYVNEDGDTIRTTTYNENFANYDNSENIGVSGNYILQGGSSETYNALNITNDSYLVVELSKANDGASVRCMAANLSKFLIKFDANGGTGSTSFTLSGDDSADLSLSLVTVPFFSNYTFLGWNEDRNATEAYYKYSFDTHSYNVSGEPISTLTFTEDKTLYAIWDNDDNKDHDEKDNPNYDIYNEINDNVSNDDPLLKSKAKQLGEDTIDNQIPASVLRVIRLIKAFPEPNLITLSHAGQVAELREAYESLSSAEKAMIGDEYVSKYNKILTAYYSLLEAQSFEGNLVIAAGAGAIIAVIFLIIFLIIKKKKEEEEEEEEK